MSKMFLVKGFEKGDLVQLKSGGLRMTVSRSANHTDDGILVEVVWFCGQELKREELPIETLMPDTRVDW